MILPTFPLLPFSGELVQIMMATANENLSAKFCNRVLKFFTRLFQLSEWQLLITFLGELDVQRMAVPIFSPSVTIAGKC